MNWASFWAGTVFSALAIVVVYGLLVREFFKRILRWVSR